VKDETRMIGLAIKSNIAYKELSVNYRMDTTTERCGAESIYVIEH